MNMEALWTFLESQSSNEFLIGGVGLALLGVTAAGLRSAALAVERLFWRRFSWSVSIDNRSAEYGKLLRWLADTGAFARLRRFRLDVFHAPRDETDRDGAASVVLTPDAGLMWFLRDGALAFLDRRIDDKPIPGARDRMETIVLTIVTLGRGRGEALFRRWLSEAAAHARSERDLWPQVHSYGDWGGWNSGVAVRPRPLATVVTRDGAAERLLADARAFLAREAWYAARGVPWRRGYLLHGPPGTGKSSLIRAVASELALDLAILDLTAKSMSDANLRDALSEAPERAALVLEDVDAAFSGRERGAAAEGLTFSGLLNGLDGLAAQEGRLVFMTTNHVETLDPALIRPGRADLHVALGLVGPREAARLFARFFPEEEALRAELATRFVGEAAPAALQGVLLARAEDPVGAQKALAALFTPRRDNRGPAAIAAE